VISNQLRRYGVSPYVTRKNLMKRQKILILAVSIFIAALFLFGALAILAAEKGPSESDVVVPVDPGVKISRCGPR